MHCKYTLYELIHRVSLSFGRNREIMISEIISEIILLEFSQYTLARYYPKYVLSLIVTSIVPLLFSTVYQVYFPFHLYKIIFFCNKEPDGKYVKFSNKFSSEVPSNNISSASGHFPRTEHEYDVNFELDDH